MGNSVVVVAMQLELFLTTTVYVAGSVKITILNYEKEVGPDIVKRLII